MKQIFQLLLCLLFLSWSLSTVVWAQQASTGHVQKTVFMNPEQECTGTGQLVYDDGTFENGYGWNAAVVTSGIITMMFTPDEYPWQFTSMCVALTQNQTSQLDFDIVVYDDDGAGGAPNTLLGEVTGLSATGIPVWPALAWYEFDMSSVAPLVDGNCYIGVRWNNVPAFPGTYIGSDESTTTTLQPGYNWNSNSGVWATNQSLWAGYRAMAIRTLGEPAVPCPVDPATDPSPADMATDVSVNVGTLSWTNGAGTTANEVWFGETGNMTMVYDGTPVTSWSIGTLDYNTDYQWRIRCKNDSCGKNSTWTFTTEQDPNLATLFFDDFENGTGLWTITNDGGTCVWEIFTPPYPNTYQLPCGTGCGGVFAADVDECGSGTTLLSSARITDPIDATNATNVTLYFDNDFNAIGASDEGYVEVSTDGGTTWTAVWSQIGVDLTNTYESVDLSAYDGMTFMLRFRSVQPGWDWWWAVDNVLIQGSTGGSPYVFSDNFDSYTAGQQLACQNPADWTTWSLDPCNATEDAYISDTYAHSAPNSFVVVQNNDEVHYWGPETSGMWEIGFYNYIPSGKTGYFNTLSQFIATQEWGLEVYFNAAGAGSINAGGNLAATFTYQYDTWAFNQIYVDLDNDVAQYWYDGNMVYEWQWTLGASGGGAALSLAANDFFGATANDEMYVDDYYVNHIIPVELTSFNANVKDGTVVLNWATATETNNRGFEVQRSNGQEFVTIGFVSGFGTSTQSHEYSFSDNSVLPGNYSYRLRQIDLDGSSTYSQVVDVSIERPSVYSLAQNYPNPFNPTTQINFSLAADSKVTLKIFDILGQEVATLLNGNMQAGPHYVSFNASSLTSGVYLYRIDATGADGSNFTSVKKMILAK